MKVVETKSRKSEKGFTLVELAVVMIIIGLLIGGILKGQELIGNAQVTATVAQLKGIDAATSTFRDMYDALPGDISNAVQRLPNCINQCLIPGNGDSTLPGAPGTAVGENLGFWAHLSAADLITGVDNSSNVVFGQGLPAAKVGGGLAVGFTFNGALTGAAAGRGGHWVNLQGTPGIPASPSMTASQAARIDRKMDDGAPATGSVIGINACAAGAIYNEAQDQLNCSIYIRIQG